jgi:hypothetical protein
MKKISEIEVYENSGSIPIGYVPTPTQSYRTHNIISKATMEPGTPQAPIQRVPLQYSLGARVLMWNFNSTAENFKLRKTYLPSYVFAGPRDARILVKGMPEVCPNALGDLIESPGTDAFDCVHTFTVVRQTLTMFQRLMSNAVPWQWNSGMNSEPIEVYPHAGLAMNAYYCRSEKALKFFFYERLADSAQLVYTCRSTDIITHETGHAILDGIKPMWLAANVLPQTSALHESFADLTSIFVALTQMEQVEAIITQTKANLHDKAYISDLAEESGLALGRSNGLRNCDNELTLSQAGANILALSQVFTGAVYDILADIFDFDRKPAEKDDTAVLFDCCRYVQSLVARAFFSAPNEGATFANIVNQMLRIVNADNMPVQYRNFIRHRFVVREVVNSPLPMNVDVGPGIELAPHIEDEQGVVQDRTGCCGTMQHVENNGGFDAMEREIYELKKSAGSMKRNGHW